MLDLMIGHEDRFRALPE